VNETGPLRFLLEEALFKLARHLRLVGFDSEVLPGPFSPDQLQATFEQTKESHRIFLHLGELPVSVSIPKGTLTLQVPHAHPDEQFRAVLKAFNAIEAARGELGFLTRCLECNTLLKRLPKTMAAERLPNEITEKHETFLICTRCERLHWIGDHTERLRLWLKRALQNAS